MTVAELFLETLQQNTLFIILGAVIIILILFRDQIGDLIFGTLFETVVDGGLSFADEIIGIGLIPGLDIGDYIAAIIIFRRNLQHAGLIAAIFGALEAANWIIGSFIPGVDWFFNIVPIYPVLKLISCVCSLVLPPNIITEGSKKLADKEKNNINQVRNALLYLQNDQKKIDKLQNELNKVDMLYNTKKYYKSFHNYKSTYHHIKSKIQNEFDKLLNECYKMNDYLFSLDPEYQASQENYNRLKVKTITDNYKKKEYKQAIIGLTNLHTKLRNSINEKELESQNKNI